MISYKCNPGKWLWGIIPLALPFVGAWFLNSPILVNKIAQSANQTLKKGGFETLQVVMDGRDAVLEGEVSEPESTDKAAKSVLALKGVRRVDVSDVKIVKPVVLTIPTIDSFAGNNSKPALGGKWHEGVATTLSIKIGEKTYNLGTNPELSSDGNGNWTLKPTQPLADGTYDVVATTTNGKKASAVDASKDELTIDTVAPTPPTVATDITTKAVQPVISGTWDHKEAASLSINIAGKDYSTGKDKEITTDDNGGWQLTPQPLKDGDHSVIATTADKFGNKSVTSAEKVVRVDTTAPATGSVLVTQGADPQPVISGTWPIAEGNSLSVAVGGKKYVLGKDKALTSDKNGNWTLTPPVPLASGKHAVTVTSADALGNESSMTSPGVVVVDQIAPTAPTISSAVNGTNSPIVRGTWAEKAGNTLKVVVAGEVFALGRDKQLKSDGKGNWTLTLTQPLTGGKHAIIAESSDAFGNLARTDKPVVMAVDTSKLDLPTVNKLATRSANPTISGTWPENSQNNLAVTLAGTRYELGLSSQLKTDGKGNWALKPTASLADGEYGVSVMVTDNTGEQSAASVAGALVVDTTPPAKPTVTTIITRDRTPTLTGSWDSADATELTVSVAGQTFSSKNKGEIEIKEDHWTVKPVNPIADGNHNVVAIASDKVGNRSTDAGTDELVLDSTSPKNPTVRPVFGTNKRPPIGGTWPEDGQNSLSINFAGKSYTLSKQGPLTSDGKGNWKLQLAEDLEPGSYDVKVKVADRLGNQSNDVSNGEIWVKAVKKPELPKPVVAASQPGNCQRRFTEALAGEKIGFGTNSAKISAASQGLISRLADIAKDCPKAKIEVSGHTDYRGSASFNQSLSEARASAVVDALVLLGVAKPRLRAVGYGEQRPLTDSRSAEGLAKNRRIEFKVEQ